MPIDIDHLRSWIGRTTLAVDEVTAVPVRALAATLDRDDGARAGEALPTCWHWLYFLPVARPSEISSDGHPRRGAFLPPVPLPRRMWAGSQLELHRPISVGQALVRRSCIEDVRLKEGRAGPLVFVTVCHELQAQGELAITERHDIVYRDLHRPGEPGPARAAAAALSAAPAGGTWTRRIVADDVMLFRYSALTFNGHRIHYDRRYATEVEGYPGLVVHGPLIATLLLELLRRELPQAQVTRFEFRAVKPIFDIAPFDLHGRRDGVRRVRLWALTPEGELAMDANAELA